MDFGIKLSSSNPSCSTFKFYLNLPSLFPQVLNEDIISSLNLAVRIEEEYTEITWHLPGMYKDMQTLLALVTILIIIITTPPPPIHAFNIY